jgi:hypothetical protein
VEYNLLPLGGIIRVARPSNVTQYKRALEARGLTDKQDFTAQARGNFCVIKRLTFTKMK